MYLLSPYDNALQEILDRGIKKADRTGVGTIGVAGLQRSYRLDTEYFPIVTGRKMFPKSVWAELIWFLSGSTMNQDLEALGAKFWGKWCDESNPKYVALRDKWGYGPGDFGPIYGWQLRHFGANYTTYKSLIKTADAWGDKDQLRAMDKACAYKQLADGELEKGFDQLAYMIDILKNDPFGSNGRRCLFSLWNPNDLGKMALPPCFVPGTLVPCSEGMRQIEDVIIGDDVLSASGTPRSVTDRWETPYSGDVVSLTAWYGLKIECTPNHPILVRGKGFVDAATVSLDDMVGIPRNHQSITPKYERVVGNQWGKRVEVRDMREEDFFMLGYFVGDGWVQGGNRCCFAVSDIDAATVLPRLRQVIGVGMKPDRGENVATYETRHKAWHRVLSEFGRKAHNKRIPMWIINSPLHLLRAFMEGYFTADGCDPESGRRTFTTTSRSLAYGLQLVAAKLGDVFSVSHQKRPPTCVIEGRTVNQRDTYQITKVTGEFAEVDDGHVWVRVRSAERRLFTGNVYNLAVADEHTYTANNIANHNCHYTYQAIADGDGGLTGILTQRSCDFPVGVPANIQFYSALTIMLAQQAGMKPREFIHNTNDSHIYLNQVDQVKEYLSRPKPQSPKLEIVKATDIYSYKVEDFVLTDYAPLDRIDVPVAV